MDCLPLAGRITTQAAGSAIWDSPARVQELSDYTNLLGVPFLEGGCDTTGFDCRGLVLFILSQRGLHIQEPDTPQEFNDIETRSAMMTDALARHCERVDKAEAWAVVTFWVENPRYSTHMGIVLKNGYEFMHILRASSVSIERLDKWKNKITGFYRVKNG